MGRLHKVHSIERKATGRIDLVEGRRGGLTRKHMSDAAQRKAKQRWAIEKPKLDNARQRRGIFFIEPNDEKIKLTLKASRRKLEVPMPAAMLCKRPTTSSLETHRSIGKRKRKIRLHCYCRRKHQTKAGRSLTQTL